MFEVRVSFEEFLFQTGAIRSSAFAAGELPVGVSIPNWCD